MPAFIAAAALCTACVVRIATLLSRSQPKLERIALPVAVLVVLALGLSQAERGLAKANLADFDATDAFDDVRRRELPYGTVLVTATPSTTFRHWGGEASERLRADVSLVPIPFLGYPVYSMRSCFETRSLHHCRGAHFNGQLRTADLLSLATRRPVFVEMDPVELPRELYRYLVPVGGLYRVLAEGATSADERLARHDSKIQNARLAGRLGPSLQNQDTAIRN